MKGGGAVGGANRGRKGRKSGLFIFWIDRSDGMEPYVRMKAAVLLARTLVHAST